MVSGSLGNIPDDCHPSIREIADYWLAIHPAEGLPGRPHFDPVSVPKLLSNIGLIEVHGRPPRFKFRLAGTALGSAYDEDYTGKWYDELFDDFEQTGQYRDLLHVVERREPHWRRGQLRIPIDRNFQCLERVHLPLAGDGTSVDMVLMLIIFFGPGGPIPAENAGGGR